MLILYICPQGCAYSTSSPNFPGSEHHKPEWTNTPNFILPERGSGIPVYRVLGDDGAVIDGATNPQVTQSQFHSPSLAQYLNFI